MNKDTFEFLKSLQETPSVSGFEQPAMAADPQADEAVADRIETDVHGNTIVAINPKGSPRVMLAGHCDQIGLMVRLINDEGYLYFNAVGGIDATVLPGTRVTVHNKQGPGRGRHRPQADPPDEAGGAQQGQDRAAGPVDRHRRQEQGGALKRVAVADPVTYRLGLERLGDDYITSPGPGRQGGGVRGHGGAPRLAAAKKLKCALFAVATVQEETGLRGARTSCYGIDPLVGIAVDVTHATDNPGADKRMAGDVALGKGPVIERGANINPVLGELLIETADEGQDSAPDRRRRRGDRHRRQRHPDLAGGRGRRAGQHPQPLHAHAGRDVVA